MHDEDPTIVDAIGHNNIINISSKENQMALKQESANAKTETVAELEARLKILKAEQYPVDMAVIAEQISELAKNYGLTARKVSAQLAESFIKRRAHPVNPVQDEKDPADKH